jgi:molybdopterin synthase sulfur carrier subunit
VNFWPGGVIVAKVYIPTIMRKNVGGQATLDVGGETVSAVLAALVTDYPHVKAQLLNDKGQVHAHINLFVNGEDIRALAGEATSLAERDEVMMISAMAGG